MAFTAGDPGESSIDADVGNALSGGSVSSSNDKDFGSDSGPQSGPNVGSKDFGQNLGSRPQGPAFGGMDMSPGRSRSMFGTTYGTQLAGINQARFNQMRGITATNPYGSDNIFSKYLGIDPKNIDYSDNISLSNRLSIANNQFSKFVNPQNRPGLPGYNPNYATAEDGKLRAGVQSEGYMTAYGPVMEQARQQSTGEMIARGLASLTPIGPFVAMMGTKEYGLPGQPGFESFDPNNPRAGGGILSAMLGGLNPAQAKEALVGAFAPVAPAPTPTQIGSVTPSQYETRADIIGRLGTVGAPVPSANIQRTSQHPLTGETSIVDGLNGFQTETLPDGSVRSVQTTGGMTEAEANAIKDSLSRNAGYNFYGDPDVEAAYPQASVETQQLAGSLFDSLFRDPMISPEAREILKEKGMTIDDLFAPKTPTPEPEKPDLMDLIQGATQTSALGGPATANQYAQVDYSNLRNVGGNLYQAGSQPSTLDTILGALGMAEQKRRPGGQYYSAPPAGIASTFRDYLGLSR